MARVPFLTPEQAPPRIHPGRAGRPGLRRGSDQDAGGCAGLSRFGELRKHCDTPAIVEISVFAACQNFNAKFKGALDTEINEFCPLLILGVTVGER